MNATVARDYGDFEVKALLSEPQCVEQAEGDLVEVVGGLRRVAPERERSRRREAPIVSTSTDEPIGGSCVLGQAARVRAVR